jgi:hypothetical protein
MALRNDDDQVISLSVHGSLTCKDLTDLILDSPEIKAPKEGLGKCPEGHACMSGEVY